MSEILVYGTPVSPFVRKVEAVLRLKSVDYDFVNINIMDMPDWFLDISPAKRIPVLRDKSISEEGINGTIADSSAICLYLNKKLNAGLYGDSAYAAGKIAWLEEYSDSELAQPLGMKLFRSILFPRLASEEPDFKTAKHTYTQVLPQFFDYLENTLDGQQFFVGGELSLADISIGCQLTQMNLIVGPPDAHRWPALNKHTEFMATHPCMLDNLTACENFLSRFVPEKVDLS